MSLREPRPSCSCRALSRRGFLRCAGGAAGARVAGAAALPLLAGCDDGLPFNLVSDEEAAEMGRQAWQDLRKRLPASRDAAAQASLQRVSERLLRAAGEDPAAWETLVFASPEINAFALPGGRIGVFEGLLGVAGNEDQLAAIVGHEIGHLQAEHAQERMTTQIAKDAGLRLIALLLQLGDVEFAAGIAAALGLGVQYGLVLPYSRRHELEADRLGLVTMAEAGYDPAEAVELWRRMDAAGGPRAPEFLATHPAPASRIAAIEAMLPELGRGA